MHDRKYEFERLVNGRLILEALAEYGPLSFGNLRAFTGISSHDRNFKRTLSTLIRKKFITRMEENFLHSYAVFYQINQSEENLKTLGPLMNRDPRLLKQKYVRMKELLHEQALAKLQHHLAHRLPESTLARDWQGFKGVYDEVFLVKKVENPKPDLLLRVPMKKFQVQRNEFARVAIEYERTRKTIKRLKEKLDTYAGMTYMDGMIWLVDDDALADLIKMIYSYQLKHSLRIDHYFSAFILIGRSGRNIEETLNSLHTIDGKRVNLEDWLHWLQSVPMAERKWRLSELRTIPHIKSAK